MKNVDLAIKNPDPLKPNYIPSEFTGREPEIEELDKFITRSSGASPETLFITGGQGTGKTHLVRRRVRELAGDTPTCYVSATRFNTQHKILRQVFSTVFDRHIGDGFHTSKLQRELAKRSHQELVLVIDDVDFLLYNEGDNLLYHLSRTDWPGLSLILIGSHHLDPTTDLEERTMSSLQPNHLRFNTYTQEQVTEIIEDRAAKALKPRSLHRNALRQIAKRVDNVRFGLYWLRSAAESSIPITDETVSRVQEQAYEDYVTDLLKPFTFHHELLYQAIQELHRRENSAVTSGPIYDQYRETCSLYDEEPLSDRRISDFLDHLELLYLISIERYYGGSKGKTREIELRTPC